MRWVVTRTPWLACLMLIGPLAPSVLAVDLSQWVEQAERAVTRAKARSTVATVQRAFDAAFRADSVALGEELIELVRVRALPRGPFDGRVARVHWRAGRMHLAEQLADKLASDSDERIDLHMIIQTAVPRRQMARARAAAATLEARGDLEPLDYQYLAVVYQIGWEIAKVRRALHALADDIEPTAGYPLAYVAEDLQGVPDFFDRIGAAPVNRVTQFGEAPLRPAPLINIPLCEVMIDGHGPFNMLLDTGGSITLSIDTAVAGAAGVESLGVATVRGAGGASESQQALIDDFRIGPIRMERVLTRVFEVRRATAGQADGIIGTGIFDGAALQMDLRDGRLVVSRGLPADVAGEEVAVRIVGDAKLMTPVRTEDQTVVGFWDSGADGIYASPTLLRKLFPDAPLRSFSTADLPGAGGMGVVGEKSGLELFLGPGFDLGVGSAVFANTSGLALSIMDTLFSPVIGVQTDVILGMPVFRQARQVSVDYRTARLIVEWE